MGEQKRRMEIVKVKVKARTIMSEFQTTRLSTGCNCLNCGILIDAATSVNHKNTPFPGAIAVCMICSHIMAYDEKIHLREVNDEEILQIAGNKDILFLINGLGGAKKAWEEKHGEGSWGKTSRDRLAQARAKAEQEEPKTKGE
jgi:transcription elongation factor Elf1